MMILRSETAGFGVASWVAGTEQVLTCAANDQDYEKTVVAGGVYRIVANDGPIDIGVADATVEGNRVRIPAGTEIAVKIPDDCTTLHFATQGGAGITGSLVRFNAS